jgi:hypothetical protein
MALFFSGKTTCLLCGEILQTETEILGFPAFIPKSHSLSEYSEGVFHRNCYENWGRKDEFALLYKKYCEIWNSRPAHLKSLKEIEDWGKKAFKDLI